jgi:hypothetical protein
LLAKNGGPLANRAVRFTFTHRDFTGDIEKTLRTDAKGRVLLGALAGIGRLAAQAGDEEGRTFDLRSADCRWPSELHAKAGEVVRIPWLDGALLRPRENISLLEMRGDSFAKSWRDAVAFKDGFLEIGGLAPGDYLLRVRGWERETKLKITRGVAAANWLLSPTRELEVRDRAPLQIASVATDAEAIVVRLRNANALTRVHVAAERYIGGLSLMDQLGGFARSDAASAIPAWRPNLFVLGPRDRRRIPLHPRTPHHAEDSGQHARTTGTGAESVGKALDRSRGANVEGRRTAGSSGRRARSRDVEAGAGRGCRVYGNGQ